MSAGPGVSPHLLYDGSTVRKAAPSLLEDAPDRIFSQVSTPLLKHSQSQPPITCVPFSHVAAGEIGYTRTTWAELGSLEPQEGTQWT